MSLPLCLKLPSGSLCSWAEVVHSSPQPGFPKLPYPDSPSYLEHTLLSLSTTFEGATPSAWSTHCLVLIWSASSDRKPSLLCPACCHSPLLGLPTAGCTVPFCTFTQLPPPSDCELLNNDVSIFNFWVPITQHRAWHELDP